MAFNRRSTQVSWNWGYPEIQQNEIHFSLETDGGLGIPPRNHINWGESLKHPHFLNDVTGVIVSNIIPSRAKNPISLSPFGDGDHYFRQLKMLSGWWFGTFVIFPHIGNVIIPIDELIFLREVQSTNQLLYLRVVSKIELFLFGPISTFSAMGILKTTPLGLFFPGGKWYSQQSPDTK